MKSTLGEIKKSLSRRKGIKNQLDSTIVKSAETLPLLDAILLRENFPKEVIFGVLIKRNWEKYSTPILEPKKSNEKVDSEKFGTPSNKYESIRINLGRMGSKIFNLRIRHIVA